MDSWTSPASAALKRKPYADEVQSNESTRAVEIPNGHSNVMERKNGTGASRRGFSSLKPSPRLGGRTLSTEASLRRQGFSGRRTSVFALQSIRRGSDDWQTLIKPFVADLAFRTVVSRPFQTTTAFRSYSCEAAVLFVDISGYSKITSAIAHRGAHALSQVVNAYLGRILNIVNKWGGDVVKFAGDAILVVWEGQEQDLMRNVQCAAKCAMDLQTRACAHPVEGTALAFRIHCGLCCGPLESDIFEAHTTANMQRLYHSVGGESLYEISQLVDLAKAGEVCISETAAELLGSNGTFKPVVLDEEDDDDNDNSGEDEYVSAFVGAKLLTSVSFEPFESEAMEAHIERFTAERLFLRNKKIEEDFIHPSILRLLSHSGMSPNQIAQIRNICVLFISMTTDGNSVNWLMEVQGVLDQCRCPIVQIIDDDKGVHVVAAVNLYETVPEAGHFGLDACQALVAKRVGCAIGVALGPTFCGVTGCNTVACRWDITGPPAVRSARLMQYAIANEMEIAVDESVYNSGPTVFARLEPVEENVPIKGSSKPVTVYSLSTSKVQCAFRLLETVHAHIHDDAVEEIRNHISGRQRSAVIVTGIPLSGKKIVCQRAAGYADLVPFLHVADETGGIMQLGKTVATWFRYSENEEVRELAGEVMSLLEKDQWSWAHQECIKLVDLAVTNGLRACILVDRVQFLDEFSVSLMRACLQYKRSQRGSSHGTSETSSIRSSSRSGPDDSDEPRGPGRICFLCTHVTMYSRKTAAQMVEEIVRSHRSFRVPVIEVLESSREELAAMFTDLADIKCTDRWIDIMSEASGYCAGYFIERGAAVRNANAKRWSQGEDAIIGTTEELYFDIPLGHAREVRLIPVKEVTLDVALRYQQIYDDLPPLFQMLVKVLSVATGKGLCKIPRFVAWEVLNDLIAEGVDSDKFATVLEEMNEMYIIKIDCELDDSQLLSFRVPAFSDIAIEICTPDQLVAIRRALLGRLSPIKSSSFHLLLLLADIHHEMGNDEEAKELWRDANNAFRVESKNFTCLRELYKWKERIRDEIVAAGYTTSDVLNEHFCTDCKPQPAFMQPLSIMKMYMGPIAMGPMGHTINAITRNIFHEWGAFYGADPKTIEDHRADLNSAAARYLKELNIVEDLLARKDLPASAKKLAEEREIIGFFAKTAQNVEDVKAKTGRFHAEFIPLISARLERLHSLVEVVRGEEIPPFVEKAEEPLRKAYCFLVKGMKCCKTLCRQDAAQHALILLATMNWKPRPSPEFLGITQYQSVARIRNKTLKRLSAGELAIFHHRQSIVDFEAFLLITSLLYEAQDQDRC